MTIRAKLYTAIVLTIIGPAGDDGGGAARDVAARRPLRRGAARGDSTRRSRASSSSWSRTSTAGRPPTATPVAISGTGSSPPQRELRRELDVAADELTDGRERTAARAGSTSSSTGSCSSTRSPGASSRRTTPSRRSGSCSVPSCDGSRPWPPRPRSWRTTRRRQATATEAAFDDARDDARRRLIAVALGAGLVIILLLVTANDIARMALEGERTIRGRKPPDTRDDGPS